jgi:hypothetical protein
MDSFMSVKIEIKSRPGTFIMLDEEVAEKIGHWGWCLRFNGYVYAHLPKSGYKGKAVRLSRAVIWAVTGEWPKKGMDVDHINHDKLDNRMENLRVVTRSINNRNLLKREGAASQFQGVYWNKTNKKWVAQAGVRIDGKAHTVGSSMTADEIIAAKCADCIRDLVGGWLPRNFPDLTFQEKWKVIGEKQRRKIRHSIWFQDISVLRGISW